jgi:hypothetical protein
MSKRKKTDLEEQVDAVIPKEKALKVDVVKGPSRVRSIYRHNWKDPVCYEKECGPGKTEPGLAKTPRDILLYHTQGVGSLEGVNILDPVYQLPYREEMDLTIALMHTFNERFHDNADMALRKIEVDNAVKEMKDAIDDHNKKVRDEKSKKAREEEAARLKKREDEFEKMRQAYFGIRSGEGVHEADTGPPQDGK